LLPQSATTKILWGSIRTRAVPEHQNLIKSTNLKLLATLRFPLCLSSFTSVDDDARNARNVPQSLHFSELSVKLGR